ncbi:MAG: ArsR/SmtB family transcription factor [Candidatus Micrarchaeia archaeon]
MAEEVIVDRELLRAIGADTRIRILRSLYERRKTQSELAAQMKISAPTVLEHVEKLEKAGLVKRIEEGRKWKYYELTQKGRKLISPERKPITAVIMLIVGLLLIGYAFFVFPYPAEEENAGVVLNKMEGQQGGEFGVAKAFTEEQPAIEETHDNGFVQMMLAFAGLVLLIAGSLNLRKSSKL